MSTCGIYAILHVPTGAAYIGGSNHVTNRYTWHRHALRRGIHTSPKLQKRWNRTKEKDWAFVLLFFCYDETSLRKKEEKITRDWPGEILNERPQGDYKLSKDVKIRMSIGRARYLDTPGAREELAERARKQHADGNFGRATWRA